MQRTALFIARFLSYLGGVLLIVELVRLRIARIAETDTPFLTVEFVVLLGVALLLLAASIALMRSMRLYEAMRLLRPSRWLPVVAGGLVISFGGAALVGRLLPFIQPYLLPFILWLLLMNLALLAVFLYPRGGQTADSQSARAALPPGILKAAVLIVLSLGVTLLALELGLRLWFGSFGTEQDRVAYIYSADEIREKTLRFRGIPYVNFGLSPTYPGHNSLGYRGPEITIPKPDGVFRIVALGGSTTYGELLADWTESYPAQLERILHDEYGYTHVEVINGGVPFYTTWDTLANFQFRVLDLQPDLVIVYHAVNDLSARALPPDSYRGIPASAGIWQNALDLAPSALYRYLAVNLGWMRNPNDLRNLVRAYEQAGRDCCDNLTHEEIAARFQANPPIYFERNLRNLIAVAEANNVRVLLSSWAYFPDATEGDWNLQALSYRQQALGEHNAITERLGEVTSASFYDLFANFPYNRDFWFVDGMHMTPAGTAEQARQYAAFLAERELIPLPE